MGRKVIHVVPNKKDGGWDVKQAGKPGTISHHDKKDRAIDRGRDEAKDSDKGQLKIHKQDGTIQTEHTYGDDPKKTPG